MALFDDIVEILRPVKLPTIEELYPEGKMATTKSDAAREMEKAMGPDHSREGIFVYHDCHRCEHGNKPCVQGGAHRCDNPHARDD